MSERPTDPLNEDELEPMPGDDEAMEAEPGELEDDEPTIEEGDAALQAAAEEAPLASLGAIGAVQEGEGQTRPMRPSERRAMRAAMEHGQVGGEAAHRVSDQASAVFVIVTVGVFVLIFLNALILGHGGLLTPLATPSPIPTLTAAPSGSAASSPTPAVSIAPTGTPGATATPGPTVTPAASAPAPTPSPSAS